MSTGSPKFTVNRIVALSLISFWLAGCTSSNTTPAPVSSVNGNGTNSGMLITPDQKNTGTMQSAPQIQPAPETQYIAPPQPVIQSTAPAQTQAIQPTPAEPAQPTAVQPVVAPGVQMQDGHIVYNRKYGNIPKGSYTGDTYTVKHGDTLFYIAWITGDDFRDLAQRNNVPAPYALNVGQVLQVGQPGAQTNSGTSGLVSNSAQNSTATVASTAPITYSANSGERNANKMLPNNTPATNTTAAAPVTAPTTVSTTVPTATNAPTNAAISAWRWPTDGKIIENFGGANGNKGIDIAGSTGQSIVATADGRVVYAGNALRGYGNLIIIKHNDDYLSAYAHNDTMLVREQQDVKAGQKIATMGSTGTSSTRLHFEIRYKGKSVNPLQYLPQR